jgi:hypothetical protein
VWFRVALPHYLTLSPEERDAQKEEGYDEEVVKQLCRYGFPGLDSPASVVSQLEANLPASKEVQVVYELIADEARAAKRADGNAVCGIPCAGHQFLRVFFSQIF